VTPGPETPAFRPIDPAWERLVRRRALAILLVGLACAAVIYARTVPDPDDPLGYYSLTSKKNLQAMEEFGGKADLLATEIREWFAGLWHGRNLSYTVAAISAFVSYAFWFIGVRMDPRPRGYGGEPG
jgi:hypothetical protein